MRSHQTPRRWRRMVEQQRREGVALLDVGRLRFLKDENRFLRRVLHGILRQHGPLRVDDATQAALPISGVDVVSEYDPTQQATRYRLLVPADWQPRT